MLDVSFTNPGEIDLRVLEVMGVSVKVTDEPIGLFGTGLKYAIAVLLRTGHQVRLYRGLEPYVFTTRKDSIRDHDFDLVYMNDQRLPFSLDYGKGWEVWGALRELLANTKDEGGTSAIGVTPPREGWTTITVSGSALMGEYAKRQTLFLESKPIAVHEHCDIHRAPLAGAEYIYYRGIRVYKPEHKSQFVYNVRRHLELTEDRSIKYQWYIPNSICRAIQACTDKDLLREVLRAPKGSTKTFESEALNFSEVASDFMSDAFVEVVNELGARGNVSARLNVRKLRGGQEFDPYTPKPHERKAIDKARAFLRQLDFDIDAYPIECVKDLGNTLGMAKNNRIYLSAYVLNMGTKQIASTLVEEFIHLDRGLRDCCYEMQNFLFDTIVSMGERITGEPL
jgi:hypothetical protein